MAEEYRQRYGREPSQRTLWAMAQDGHAGDPQGQEPGPLGPERAAAADRRG